MKKLIPILWIGLVGFIAIDLESPIPVPMEITEDFNANNTIGHLKNMSEEIHFMGTERNFEVRDYILNEFQKLEIPTEVFVGHTLSSNSGSYNRLARTENIIATIKGTQSGKSVMIAGHYDSVLSSPGAADDVHAVACMIEVAKLLKAEEHQNDITFLITDGEEMGLLGAKAFIETKDLSNIGLVLNYEARGNSGPSHSFEWSEGNAWLVEQVKKAGHRPVTSSLSYEIYKLLPNDTDFSYFKEAGLAGINHAFIDGFSYYHNPDDRPENINMESVQHTGENMYHLTKHFANIDLSNAVSHDASFFNFLSMLVVYPSNWNLIILLLVWFLIVWMIYKSVKIKRFSLKSGAFAFLHLLISAVLLITTLMLISKYVFNVYPDYNTFYSGQFYNHKWYMLVAISLTLVFFWLIVNRFTKRHDVNVLRLAALVIIGILALGCYLTIPTATYVMSLPALILGILITFENALVTDNKKWNFLLKYLVVVIPLALWMPLVQNIFLAFSLKMLAAPAMIVWIIALSLLICFPELWRPSKLVLFLGITGVLMGFVMGHLTSKPTEAYPLPSSAFYTYDVDQNVGHWATNNRHLNVGNQSLLANAKVVPLNLPNRTPRLAAVTNDRSDISIALEVYDTLKTNFIKLKHQEKAFMTRVYLANTSNLLSIKINGQKAVEQDQLGSALVIDVYGMTQDSLQIELMKIDTTLIQKVGINSKFQSLPVKDLLPENARRVDGFTSIVRTVSI